MVISSVPGLVWVNTGWLGQLDTQAYMPGWHAFSQQATASCHSNKTLCFVFQVRPKLPLLKILQAAGAQGETFTLKEVGSLSRHWNYACPWLFGRWLFVGKGWDWLWIFLYFETLSAKQGYLTLRAVVIWLIINCLESPWKNWNRSVKY